MMKTRTNKPEGQHFVPKMLLSRFVNERGQVHCFDERFKDKDIKQIKPENFFLESNIYTLPDNEDGNKDFSAEKDFSKLENDAAKIIKKTIEAAGERKSPKLTPSQKKTLDWFLFCQWSRVPDREDARLDRAFGKGPHSNPRIRDLAKENLDSLRKEIRVTSLTSCVRNPNKRILSIFGYKGLAIGIAQGEERFVIGSNPVLQVPDGYYFFGRIVQFWLPIAPDVAVTPYFPQGTEDFIEFKDEDVRSFNKTVFRQSKAVAGNSEELIRRVTGL